MITNDTAAGRGTPASLPRAPVTMCRQQFWRATSSYAAEPQPELLPPGMSGGLMWRHVIAASTRCSIPVFFLEASHSSRCGRQSRVLDGFWVRCSLCSNSCKFGSANGRDAPASRASEQERCPGWGGCPREQLGEGLSWERSTPPEHSLGRRWRSQGPRAQQNHPPCRGRPPPHCTSPRG